MLKEGGIFDNNFFYQSHVSVPLVDYQHHLSKVVLDSVDWEDIQWG
jgi:hypothetical protein